MLKQKLTTPPNTKTMINIGALLDVPTGFYIKGIHGESVLLGGLGAITAVVGRGNRFKSTILHFMMLSAADRLMSTSDTSMSTYDTEINIHEHALKRFTTRFDSFRDVDIIDDGTWVITDKTIYYANKWFEEIKAFLKTKIANQKKIMVTTPFMDRNGSQLSITSPTFSEVDSFSEFETEDVGKMQDENELGDSGANTIHMRQGLAKTRFLMEVPTLFGKTNHFLLMTAHLGDGINMAAGPYAPVPDKKLQHMKAGDKIKGVTEKFFFLMNNCWHAANTKVLINQTTKSAEYPRNSDENSSKDTDLNLVTMVQLRGKSGPTGFSVGLIVSQNEGVLPSLTEFHHIKSADRFGLSGTLQNYHLDLLPDVSLSRTTVRKKIDKDLALQRALNITSELYQIKKFHRSYEDIMCTPKELYDDIAKLGYDWNMLLTETRGWWTVNDKDHPLKFLSTLDLLNMRAGTYTPYWAKK